MVKRDEVALSSGDSIKYREHGSFLEEEQKKFSLTMKTIRKWSFGVSYKQRAEYSFLEREIETASFQTIGFLRKIDCIEKQASINL